MGLDPARDDAKHTHMLHSHRPHNRVITPLLSLCLVVWLSGCSAYDIKGGFVPQPAETVAQLAPAGSETTGERERVRTLASIIGVLKADKKAARPRSAEVKLRIENRTDEAVTLDPASVELVGGDLESFPPPIEPRTAVMIEPGATRTVRLLVPFPEERVDLSGLNLQWALEVGDRRETQSVSFRRRERDYGYDGYPGGAGRPRIGVGVGVGHLWY